MRLSKRALAFRMRSLSAAVPGESGAPPPPPAPSASESAARTGAGTAEWPPCVKPHGQPPPTVKSDAVMSAMLRVTRARPVALTTTARAVELPAVAATLPRTSQ